jgi:UDP-glucose 4-epimerase
MHRVIVTGGLGQIGSHVTELLLARGDKVIVIDDLTTGRKEHLETHPNLSIYIESITNKSFIDKIFADFKPDCVVHTAASYKDPDDWYSDTMVNCVGAANVIKAATENSCKRFIYFQTALCYGLKPETSPIGLDHIRKPEGSTYAITKTTNELILELSGLSYVTFRLANVVGPRNVAGPLPIFFQRIKDGKKCFVTKARRDFVFVGDLARTVVRAVDGTGQGAYHFSSGKDVAISELFDAVVGAMKLDKKPEVEIRDLGPDDVESILLDPSRTFKDFGAIEFTSLQATVDAAIDYYTKYGTLGEYTHLRLNKEN